MLITVPGLSKEALLAIWLETQPTANSPYALYGCPPMWRTAELADGHVLFTRPAKVMTRPAPLAPYHEVDGVGYQFQKDGRWTGQGCSATFADFLAAGARRIA